MAKRNLKLSVQVIEEASSWFIDFNEGEVDVNGREEFNAWLRRSPEHVQAYLQISAFWEDANALEKKYPDLEVLIARAREEQNVFPLELGARATDEERLSGQDSRGKPTRLRWLLALAASGLLAIVVGALIYSPRETYSTDVGEQRSITLEDGSVVEINSRSRLRVHFSKAERSVDLLEGQALFRVAKNPARPFVVTTGYTHVRAVGTEFDVYRKRTGTVVTVVEGRVAVFSPLFAGEPQGEGTSLLAAGEQLTISLTTRAKPTRRVRANVAGATAWTEKKLIFEETPLREVVEEFNRYNRQKLVIRDPDLYDYHVSGVFPSTDSSRMVEFLRQRFGVTMDRSGDQIEISKALR